MKTFLATVALQLVEGALSLDRPYRDAARAVTSRIAAADGSRCACCSTTQRLIPEWTPPTSTCAWSATRTRLHDGRDHRPLARRPPSFEPARHGNTPTPTTRSSASCSTAPAVRVACSRARARAAAARARAHLPARAGDRTMATPTPMATRTSAAPWWDLSAVDPSMAGTGGGHAMVTTSRPGPLPRGAPRRRALLPGRHPRAMTTMVAAPNESGLPHRYGWAWSRTTARRRHPRRQQWHRRYATMMYRIPASDTTAGDQREHVGMFANALEVYSRGSRPSRRPSRSTDGAVAQGPVRLARALSVMNTLFTATRGSVWPPGAERDGVGRRRCRRSSLPVAGVAGHLEEPHRRRPSGAALPSCPCSAWQVFPSQAPRLSRSRRVHPLLGLFEELEHARPGNVL